MNFNRLIKKAYVLLEQDQAPAGAAPAADPSAQPPSAATSPTPNPDPNAVQNSEEGLLEVAKKLILCFKQISESNDIKEKADFIQDLMDASKGEAKVALQSIKQVCDEYSPQAVPQQF